jgi:hypothetical protein
VASTTFLHLQCTYFDFTMGVVALSLQVEIAPPSDSDWQAKVPRDNKAGYKIQCFSPPLEVGET